MEKQSLNKFIQKYNLSGIVESVRWDVSDNSLHTTFISGDKCLLGMVTASDIEFPTGQYGIYDTAKLLKILGVLDADFDVSTDQKSGGVESIHFKGSSISANYMVSDLSIIPDVPEMKMIPEFDVEIYLDGSFIDSFIKAKTALSEETNFNIHIEDGSEVATISIGNPNASSNRIRLSADCKSMHSVNGISFNAEHLKNVLLANREVSNPVLHVSTQGLANIEFTFGNYTSKYYLVQTV